VRFTLSESISRVSKSRLADPLSRDDGHGRTRWRPAPLHMRRRRLMPPFVS
jgi:hypothetical protein